MAQPTLTTERLRLVPLSDAHLEGEVELDSDPEVLRYLQPRARTRAEVERDHVRRVAAGDGSALGFWAGLLDGEFVGWWILRAPTGPDQPPVPGEAELGYRLLRRHWRRGFASEASRELLRHGFADVGLERIFAQTMAVNAGSRAVMTSLGMTFVRSFAGTFPEPVPGWEQGEVEYGITRPRWLRRAASS